MTLTEHELNLLESYGITVDLEMGGAVVLMDDYTQEIYPKGKALAIARARREMHKAASEDGKVIVGIRTGTLASHIAAWFFKQSEWSCMERDPAGSTYIMHCYALTEQRWQEFVAKYMDESGRSKSDGQQNTTAANQSSNPASDTGGRGGSAAGNNGARHEQSGAD